MASTGSLSSLLDFIARLEAAGIYYTLSAPTERAIMVTVAVPGERWEIEFREDSEVEVEVFRSQGVQEATSAQLDDLFR